ncbi:integrase [Sporosarcina sp. A2]|uniref:integrase n=1 Tax=Sporosarcina sp. A2 TaxID=3393449 RepID=UPI003D7AEFA4
MKDQFKEDIETIICETIATVNMEINVVQKKTGVNMMYDFIENCVLVDSERLHVARAEMENEISLPDYIQALTLHELGHALDRQALMESLPGTLEVIALKKTYSRQELYGETELLKKVIDENDRDYQFEETAWAHAERLNDMCRIVSAGQMEQMKKHGLATYKELFLQDSTVYEGLVAAEPAIDK